MIKCNYQMRLILLKRVFVGVVGPKKNGKSSFIKRMTGKKTGASATEETKTLAAYTLPSCDWTLVDYPHLESTNTNYMFQFCFSKFILDHVILIFNSRCIGESLTKDFQNFIVEIERNRGRIKKKNEENKETKRFTIVFTYIDKLLEVKSDNCTQEFLDYLDGRHQIELLRPLRDKIIWTSLIQEGMKKLIDNQVIEKNNGKLNILIRFDETNDQLKNKILGEIIQSVEEKHKAEESHFFETNDTIRLNQLY